MHEGLHEGEDEEGADGGSSFPLRLQNQILSVSDNFEIGKLPFEPNNYQPPHQDHFFYEQLQQDECKNSLDLLASHINKGGKQQTSLSNFVDIYNEEKKLREGENGCQALEIQQVESQSEDFNHYRNEEYHQYDQDQGAELYDSKSMKLNVRLSDGHVDYYSYFPQDLADVLSERGIPFEYVKGLLMARNQHEIKSTRRLKVERYLQKRRNKTWNKKICYNCRQKVAEERLRIKGKFIKKRRAMQILGLTIPIQTSLLKKQLQEVLKGKTKSEIVDILNLEKAIQQGENSSLNE